MFMIVFVTRWTIWAPSFDGDEGLVVFFPEKGLYMSLECGQTNGALGVGLFAEGMTQR